MPGSSAPGAWMITGSSRGIGRALATELLEQDVPVALAVRDRRSVEDLVDRFPDLARAYELDIRDWSQGTAVARQVVEELGVLDAVVNNAGFYMAGAFEDIAEPEVRAQFETNFFGTWNVTRAMLPALRRQGHGTVVNVSSLAGLVGMAGTSAYSASKFAVEGMTEALALEVAPFGIKVLLVEPGPFRTEMRGASLRTAQHLSNLYPDYGAKARAGDGRQPGDPRRAAKVIIDAVRASTPPGRLVLGGSAIDAVRQKVVGLLADGADWDEPSRLTAYVLEGEPSFVRSIPAG